MKRPKLRYKRKRCTRCRKPFNTDSPGRRLCTRCRFERLENHGGIYARDLDGRRYRVGSPHAYREMIMQYFEATKSY